MIGELWNKLKEDEKAVYQDKAMKDKERYRMEMENYRERLRTNQVINDAVPIQQRFPDIDVDMVEVDVKDGRDSPNTALEDESGSSMSESEEDDDQIDDKDDEDFSDAQTPPEDAAAAAATATATVSVDDTGTAAASALRGGNEVKDLQEEVKADENSWLEKSVGDVSFTPDAHHPPPSGHGAVEGEVPLP